MDVAKSTSTEGPFNFDITSTFGLQAYSLHCCSQGGLYCTLTYCK